MNKRKTPGSSAWGI